MELVSVVGILKPKLCKLPEESRIVYKSVYCSLCHALKQKHGTKYTLFISHELVQLNIMLLKYFKIASTEKKCIIPFNQSKKDILIHPVLEKSADLCLILVWFKIIDSRVDKENLKYRLLYRLLKSKIEHILNTLTEGSRKEIHKYIDAIYNNLPFEEMIYATGNLAETFFSILANELALPLHINKSISPLSNNYGKLIAISDPLIDFMEDRKQNKSNPIELSCYNSYYNIYKDLLSDTINSMEQHCKSGTINYYAKTCFIIATNRISQSINKTRVELEDSLLHK